MSETGCAAAAASVAVDDGRDPIVCSGLAVGAMGILLLVAGCTKVGPDFVKPDASIADGWTEVGELQLNATQTDHADWWKGFDDTVLDRLIDEA